MKKESPRLRGLIGQLRGASPTRQVRLIRIIFPRWLREHPQRATRASRYRARTTHPFDIDLGNRLDKSWIAIEKLRAQAAAIPGAVLKEIERAGVTRAGVLLEKLEHELRVQADGAMRQDQLARLTKARQIVTDHVDPPPLVPPRRVVIGMAFAFISQDIPRRLDRLVQNGTQFDAIITQPPHRVTFNGRHVTATTADGPKQPLWEPAMFAKLIKPNRAICLFCSKDSLAGWTIAMLEAGLLIDRVIRWQPALESAGLTGQRTRDDTLILVCGRGIPQSFGADHDIRRIAAPASAAGQSDDSGLQGGTIVPPNDPMVRLIETFTQPGDHILDPFAGAGAVGMAAITCRRDYLGAEADPVEGPRTIVRLQRAYDALQAQARAEDHAAEPA